MVHGFQVRPHLLVWQGRALGLIFIYRDSMEDELNQTSRTAIWPRRAIELMAIVISILLSFSLSLSGFAAVGGSNACGMRHVGRSLIRAIEMIGYRISAIVGLCTIVQKCSLPFVVSLTWRSIEWRKVILDIHVAG